MSGTGMSSYYLPAGSGGTAEYDLEVTPESASWGYSGLRVLTLEPAGTHTLLAKDMRHPVVRIGGKGNR